MGGRQSKRSVDITTTPKKGEVDGQPLDGRLEKIEDGAEVGGPVKPAQANGDTHGPADGVQLQDGEVMVNGSEAVVDEDGDAPAPVKPSADGDQASVTASATEPEVNGTDGKESADADAKEGAEPAADDKPKGKKDKAKKEKDKKEKSKDKDKEKAKPVARKFSLRNLLRGKQDTAEAPKENAVAEEKSDAPSNSEAPADAATPTDGAAEAANTDSPAVITDKKSETEVVSAPEVKETAEPPVSAETTSQPAVEPDTHADTKAEEQKEVTTEVTQSIPSTPPPVQEPKPAAPVVEEVKVCEVQPTESSVPSVVSVEMAEKTEEVPPAPPSPLPEVPASPALTSPAEVIPSSQPEAGAVPDPVVESGTGKSTAPVADISSESEAQRNVEPLSLLTPTQTPSEPVPSPQELITEKVSVPKVEAETLAESAPDTAPQSTENITVVAVDSVAPDSTPVTSDSSGMEAQATSATE